MMALLAFSSGSIYGLRAGQTKRTQVIAHKTSLLKLHLDLISDLLNNVLINIVLRELAMYFFFNFCRFNSS
jgi:hypothetical protein